MLFWNVLYISTGDHTCYYSCYNMFMGILHHFQLSSIISSLPDVLLCVLLYIFSEISTYIIFIFDSLPDITMELFKKEVN